MPTFFLSPRIRQHDTKVLHAFSSTGKASADGLTQQVQSQKSGHHYTAVVGPSSILSVVKLTNPEERKTLQIF